MKFRLHFHQHLCHIGHVTVETAPFETVSLEGDQAPLVPLDRDEPYPLSAESAERVSLVTERVE